MYPNLRIHKRAYLHVRSRDPSASDASPDSGPRLERRKHKAIRISVCYMGILSTTFTNYLGDVRRTAAPEQSCDISITATLRRGNICEVISASSVNKLYLLPHGLLFRYSTPLPPFETFLELNLTIEKHRHILPKYSLDEYTEEPQLHDSTN